MSARRLPILAVALVVGAACATRGDVDFLSAEHQRIVQRQAELEERITALEQTMARLHDLLQGIRADFRADLGAMRAQLNALESAVRGTESRIEQLRQYTPPPVPQPAPGDTLATDAVGEIELYNAAIADYTQARLDLARRGFEEYLRRFPTGPSAADAQFWLGQIAFDQGRYDMAITELRVVVSRFPRSSKAPLALRKIGDAHRALGQEDRARAAYQELIDRYPNSQEAQNIRREGGA